MYTIVEQFELPHCYCRYVLNDSKKQLYYYIMQYINHTTVLFMPSSKEIRIPYIVPLDITDPTKSVERLQKLLLLK